MKITFERTGGFGNIPVNVSVDTQKVSDDVGAKLKEKLQKLLPFKGQTEVKAMPDMYQYNLTVTDNEENNSLCVSDADVTDDMEDLFDFLMSQ